MSSHNNRITKLEQRQRLPERGPAHVVLQVLAAFLNSDDEKILVQAARIVERALSPAISHPIMSSGDWTLLEQASKILQRVEQRYKAEAVFKEVQLDVDLGKLSDAQLERMTQGESFFKTLLDERNRL